MPVLEIDNVVTEFDGGRKLKGVTLSVESGEVHAILGPNGAGKSTLMAAITRLISVRSGSITLNGNPLPRKAFQVARAGIALAPQNYPIFASLTVEESLRLRGRDNVEESLVIFPELKTLLSRSADKLSGGQRQMLSIAMCLTLKPKVLLLDEPSSGLAPKVVETVFDAIRRVSKLNVSVLVVEQNAAQVLELADRASLLEDGRVTLSGPSAQIRDDPHVRVAYLGI